MIQASGRKAELCLDAEVYSEEALRAAALRFSHQANLEIAAGRVTLTLKDKRGDAAAAALEFLNEALSHQYRLFVQTLNMPALAGVMSAAKAAGFGPPPRDYALEREPQVVKDRAREIQQLAAKAKTRGAA